MWKAALRRAVVACDFHLAPSALAVLGLAPADVEVLEDLIGEALRWREETGGG